MRGGGGGEWSTSIAGTLVADKEIAGGRSGRSGCR